MSEPKRRPWRDYFDSDYITGDALPEPRTFTIASKSRDEVEGNDGKEHKLALTFSDGQRWLVNVTNAKYMEHLFGSPYPSDWTGKRVTLAFDPTIMFGKERVGGIRVIGSPDISEPVTFQFQENSRKRPRQVTLVPTAGGNAPTVDGETGEVSEQPAIPAQVPADGPSTPVEPQDSPEPFSDPDGDSGNEADPLDLALGNVSPIRKAAATKQQIGEIERLVKSTGIYEVEVVGILDTYGAVTFDDLTKQTAQYVIDALRERQP